MLTKVLSATVTGIEASIVTVEVDQSNGIPSFVMTGYLNARVTEAGDRVRTAIKNIGYMLPSSRVVVNVSPASIRKSGTMLDLPIAVGILCNLGIVSDYWLKRMIIVGELSLDGSINAVSGVLPMVYKAYKEGIEYCLVPEECREEARLIEGMKVITVSNLQEVVAILNQSESIIRASEMQPEMQLEMQPQELDCDLSQGRGTGASKLDFSDVRGQLLAKRAMLIAAAGRHNLLMMGSPGSGKTMMASRIPGILPPLNREEMLEVATIYSVKGQLNMDPIFLWERPFKAPHHTITQAGLIGGGMSPTPGDISLAHQGVLFLDELTEFKPDILENLRQPLEEKCINIVRHGNSCRFPADFMLVAAMNPCKCGYFPDRNRCKCTEYDILHHYGKLSRPFLDRFDLSVQVDRPNYEEIAIGYSNELSQSENGRKDSNDSMPNSLNDKIDTQYTTENMRKQVLKAEEIQRKRYASEKIHFNSQLSSNQLRKYCTLDEKGEALMKNAYMKYNLTARGYGKLLKVARTIADLEGREQIEAKHVSEALCFRNVNMEEWSHGTR